jgi:glycosyltransferase involved in cell wall biosynthesis
VLFAIGGLEAGGAERQLVELLVRVNGVHADALVVTWEAVRNPENRRRLREAGIRHVTLGPFPPRNSQRRALVVSRLASLIRRVRPDVVYPWLEQASLVVAPLARMQGIPIVVARRNISGASAERHRAIAIAIRRAECLASVVTANSPAVAEAAVARGISEARIRLVPNGHEAGSPLPAPRGEPVRIGYVAGFRPEKGHLRLLDALAFVNTDRAWSVDMAGTGDLRAVVESEVERRRLSDRIRFLGHVSDMRGFWRERAFAVLLSDHEGCPNALIEAAFAGRPLLATRVGGVPEIVTPDGGFLVSTDDPEGTGHALSRLVASESLRRRLGQAAYEHAREQFAIENFVRGHLGALEDAIAAGARSRRGRRRPYTSTTGTSSPTARD